MKTAELVKALLDVDEEVFLLHGEINPHPTVVIVGGAAQRGFIDWGFLRNLSTTITKLLHRLFLRIDTKSWFISMNSSRESGGGNESYIQRFPPRILSRIDWTANG